MKPVAPATTGASTAVLCATLAEILLQKSWSLCTAESCTGGLIAAACTDQSGSSAWFERGFVSYSNDAKTGMLGVAAKLIDRFGAVSEEVVRAMAHGAIAHSRAQVALAVTGVAGPSGGSKSKPVGTVWFGWSVNGQLFSESQQFSGDRHAIRNASVLHALQRLSDLLRQ